MTRNDIAAAARRLRLLVSVGHPQWVYEYPEEQGIDEAILARAYLAEHAPEGANAMIKRDELSNPNSCMSRADPEEATFVLLGRDVTAAATVQWWINMRVRLGKNAWADEQIVEAMEYTDTLINQSKDPVLARTLWSLEFQNRPPGLPPEAPAVAEIATVFRADYPALASELDRKIADIPGHVTARTSYEVLCGALGLHPETELDDVLRAIQSVRSDARNYPALQLIIGDLRRKLAEAGVEGSPPPGQDTTIGQWSSRAHDAESRVLLLQETLEWYAEQARLCRLIHAEGDHGRNALANDGGRRARAVLDGPATTTEATP